MNRCTRCVAMMLAAVGLAFGSTPVDAQVVHYYHLDALGSVRAVTDQAGTVVERHDYLPYGEEWNPPPVTQPIRFTGKERDTETGLDYFGARYYGAKIARFTTVDPAMNLQKSLVDPQRWNRYAYVSNNPLRYVDPDGREQAVTMGGRIYMGGVDGTPAGSQQAQNQVFALLVAGASAVTAGFVAPELLAWATVRAADPLTQATVHELLEGATGGPPTGASRAGLAAGETQFVVTGAGEAVIIPRGAAGPNPIVNASGKTTGFGYSGGSGGPGLEARVSNVRIMDPTAPSRASPGYPNGYVTYENRMGQGVSSTSGKTIPNSSPERHIRLGPSDQ